MLIREHLSGQEHTGGRLGEVKKNWRNRRMEGVRKKAENYEN